MRRIQKVAIGVLLFGFSAGVSPSYAAPAQSRARPASPAAHAFLGPLWSLLFAAWDRSGCQIDPFGRCLPAQGPAGPADPPAGASADTRGDSGCQIGPLGGCPAAGR